MSNPISRRMMLRSAAGAALTIPFLPSLMSPTVARAGGIGEPPRRFVSIQSPHGTVWRSRMFPDASLLTETMQHGGHTIRAGALVPQTAGGMTTLSPVLRASESRLTPERVAQLNVVSGLDCITRLGHHTGGFLGNPFASIEAEPGHASPRPTVDQALAWSDDFYPDLSTILERSLVLGISNSWGWSSPASGSGEIQQMARDISPLAVFNRIFMPSDDPAPVDPRPPVVDRVFEHYQSLRTSNRRLSAADRQRLDDHLERIDELQRKLEVTVSCGDQSPPVDHGHHSWHPEYMFDPAAHREYWHAFNDVIATAFLCDTTRVVSIGLMDHDNFTSFSGDWHQDIAHGTGSSGAAGVAAQDVLVQSNQQVFEEIFLDLMAKLDVPDAYGGTVLDNSLITWQQESGAAIHEGTDMPLITAGSAGGRIQTGVYADYRNENLTASDPWGSPMLPGGEAVHPGLSMQQWFATMFHAMDIPVSGYSTNARGGYAEADPSPIRAAMYPQSVLEVMGQPLPFLV